jgi:hypothetical protein
LSWAILGTVCVTAVLAPSILEWLRPPLTDVRAADRARLPVEWDPHLEWEKR